jgi:HlyD family secretion protein
MDMKATPTGEAIAAPKPSRLALSIGAAWRHKWSALAIVLALGAASLGAIRAILGPEIVTAAVVRGDLVQTVVASGHIETPFRVEIASQITGTVEDVLVLEGEEVKQGQKLIAIEASELQAAVVQNEGAVAQAEARLRQLQELTKPAADQALVQAHANLLNAQAAYDRAEKLARDGYGTRATLDDATKNLNVAQTQVRTAELQVFTSSPVGSDYVMAQTQLAQARANLNTARSRLGYASITAPRDGVLITRNVERGTVVQPGKALLVLAPAGGTQVVVQIDEKNLGLLSLGQTALASADAYPDQRFAAVIAYINPSVDINRASVQIKLSVPEPPAYLRQDMTVSVDIQIARRDQAVVVPSRAVHEVGSGAPWVLKAVGGRAQLQPVKLGLRGTGQYQVLDGLQPGDLVVPSTAGVRAGQRIRAVRP